ncbi:heavy metal-binding domain-containing protein [Hymenobacter sp. GOD-10R]|uniref:heavy metal-binding domain-containing protein n=1 Tax=Hymenobacter sp. GOD-10R TaxID=3093922 RepID=UPI002D79B530|nr:heavy metal-binding domain-containing protein [Hymenobacter sp. GOD-10R]WRQ28739.1 heavy metal-binding domain-containing protein [Hymenobacter sp. GOD-10R]
MRTKKLAFVGLMIAMATGLVSCDSKPAATTDQATTPAAQAPVSQVAAYRCPMGCEGSASNKPGKCPVCEMELERNPDYKATATAAPDSL